MARIRTIKPEFPQSESMGKVSRDARLLFVMLWPICDDHGRTRAASRMLASLLFPYDDDASGLIDRWLGELEREGCIRRYAVNGSTYLEVCNWLTHQKIDKPSKPAFPEPSGVFASPREDSLLEGKGEEGKGKDQEQSSGDDSVERGSPTMPACPHDEIIAAYHELLPTLSRVRDWTPKRQQALRARWREKPERRDLAWWRKFFTYVAASDFLTGKVEGRNGRAFECDLEWLVKSENFTKVVEGKYENRGRA